MHVKMCAWWTIIKTFSLKKKINALTKWFKNKTRNMYSSVLSYDYTSPSLLCVFWVFYVVTMPKNTPVTCVPDCSRSPRAEVAELKCELAHSDETEMHLSLRLLYGQWNGRSLLPLNDSWRNERLTLARGFCGAGLVGDVHFGFIWTECLYGFIPAALSAHLCVVLLEVAKR